MTKKSTRRVKKKTKTATMLMLQLTKRIKDESRKVNKLKEELLIIQIRDGVICKEACLITRGPRPKALS